MMIVQVNTDKNIEGTARLELYVSEKISRGLKHFAENISRVEVHLSDQNGQKEGSDDINCKIEARIEGIQPAIVVGKGGSPEIALDDAVDKMKAKLGTIMGKIKERK